MNSKNGNLLYWCRIREYASSKGLNGSQLYILEKIIDLHFLHHFSHHHKLLLLFEWKSHHMFILKCLGLHIVRAVRSKKYVDCANWDKSMKLGTETHYRLYVKNFKGDTPRKSRDC